MQRRLNSAVPVFERSSGLFHVEQPPRAASWDRVAGQPRVLQILRTSNEAPRIHAPPDEQSDVRRGAGFLRDRPTARLKEQILQVRRGNPLDPSGLSERLRTNAGQFFPRLERERNHRGVR